AGVLLRWFTNVYLWHWRTLVVVSAAMELVAFLIFFRAVSQHKPEPASDGDKTHLNTWIFVVIAGSISLLRTLLLNLVASVWIALRGTSAAFPMAFDQRFLVIAAWGFMVPFVWGFSAKWLPTFLGTRGVSERRLGIATSTL